MKIGINSVEIYLRIEYYDPPYINTLDPNAPTIKTSS